jgi:hypothetical protein
MPNLFGRIGLVQVGVDWRCVAGILVTFACQLGILLSVRMKNLLPENLRFSALTSFSVSMKLFHNFEQ